MIDIGANLSHESFSHDLSSVLDHARAAGITQIVVTGASEQASIDAQALALRWPKFLYATAGVHPHHAGDYTAQTHATLSALHACAEVVAVGETGLDYFRDLSPRPTQQFAFEQQLDLALACGKPLFLHQRDAHDRSLVASGRGCCIDVTAVIAAGLPFADCPRGHVAKIAPHLADLVADFGLTPPVCREIEEHLVGNRLVARLEDRRPGR